MLARRVLCRSPNLWNESRRIISRRTALSAHQCLNHRTHSTAPEDRIFSRGQHLLQDQDADQEQIAKSRDNETLDETGEDQFEQELRSIRDVAIADLEQRLGKPLWQAIQEDGLAERIENGEFGVLEDQQLDAPTPRMPDSSISRLRQIGAPIEDVAREARNVHGEHLPDSVLSEEETKVYTRLYGEPLPEDTSLNRQNSKHKEASINVLLDAGGEKVHYRLEDEEDIERGMYHQSGRQEHSVSASFNPMSLEAIANEVGGRVYNEEEYDELDDNEEAEASDDRTHPLTRIGKFATFPRTFFLPKETFIEPIQAIMRDYSNKQLRELCERTFGGPGLPNSPLTPRITQVRQQLPIPLDAGQHNMGQMEANAFLTTVMPPTYASIQATLVETRKRLGPSWLNDLLARPGGPRILDAGSGGAGILAWRDVLNAHWEQLHSSSKEFPPLPASKTVVLTGSDTLRHRAATMLENTTFVPRLPDYVHTRDIPTLEDDRPAQQRKQFDVIIASHSLFGLKEEWERKQHVQNLWQLLSDQGGVLILIEKGIPRGFEAIAAAREMLLERYIAIPEGQETYYSTHIDEDAPPKKMGMIIAPCTNHDRCPLYKVSGVSKGRKDICSFQQRYIRPPFLQNVLGASDRNHDDVDFSYLVVMKGDDLRQRSFTGWDHISDPMSAPKTTDQKLVLNSQNSTISQIQSGFEESESSPPPTHLLPRILNRPLKRRGHVTIDLCTPTAEIRRWTIPRSFSQQAYRDARKARWGDLWALGAKTSVVRNLRLGTPVRDLEGAGGQIKGAFDKPRNRKEKLQMQAEKIREADELDHEEAEREHEELLRLIDQDNLLDEDDDDELIDMDTLLPKKKKNTQAAKATVPNRTPMLAGSRSSVAPKSQPEQELRQSTKRSPKSNSRSGTNNMIMENAGPERIGEIDVLADWSEEFSSAMFEDEASRRVSERGHRPTSRNTQRMKRDMRRAKRKSGIT